jgi:uncharacterized membrane protein YkvA (DUF1232 family)
VNGNAESHLAWGKVTHPDNWHSNGLAREPENDFSHTAVREGSRRGLFPSSEMQVKNRRQNEIKGAESATTTSWLHRQTEKCNDGLSYLIKQTRFMTLVLRHPRVPWPAKMVAACSVGYIFSPIQLIPSFIPVIGQLDDLAVLVLGMRMLRILTPAPLLTECAAQANSETVFTGVPHPEPGCTSVILSSDTFS